MEPGFTLLDPIKQGDASYGLLVAINDRGEVVWYYRGDESISDARRLKSGNLLFLGATGAVEIDMLGNLIQNLLDILDPYRIGFGSLGSTWNSEYSETIKGTVDWAHANAVIEDPADDSLIVSVRHQDALIKIDRNSGNLIWILGTPDGWNPPWNRYLLKPIGEFEWQYHQHAPELTPQGTILVFDNGNFRHRPFDQRPDQNYSRAVEYSVDSDGMTVSQVWSYEGPGDEMFFSNALGDVDWLPRTGNVLITDGSRVTSNVPARRWARILEVTHTSPAKKVFELVIQDAANSDSSGWRVYRSERLPNLYPPEQASRDSEHDPAPTKSLRPQMHDFCYTSRLLAHPRVLEVQ